MIIRFRLFPLLLVTTVLHASPVILEVGPGRPLANLVQARDAVRTLRNSPESHNGITVKIHAGTYPLEESFRLESIDSGTAEAPTHWEAASGESVILSGGVAVKHWMPVTDAHLLSRFPESARSRIVVADLAAEGVADLGRIAQRGNPGLELFFQGRRMPLSRYPNDGWLLIEDVPQTGPKRFLEGLEREKRFDGVPAGRHYGRITYPGDEPSRWSEDNDITLHGYWTWDWSDSFQPVQSIDQTKHEITLAEPHHHYGYTKNQRFRFLNVIEEIDQPGEWALDRKRGLLYFYPPAPLEGSASSVSLTGQALVHLDGASNLTFSGFTLEAGRGTGIRVTGGESVVIAGCTLRNLGGEAVTIDGGKNHTVTSCNLHDLANGAIRVTAGDRATLASCGHLIVNNHIHDFSQWLRTGQYGVMLDGVGITVRQNRIHDAPFEAMYSRGNDHLIELNDIYRVCQETGDAGGIHTGRDYTWQGNVIRYNYWHDLKGPGLHGVTAVYLDDFSSGYTVHGNIFYRAGRGIQIGGGRDNAVTNNLFIECHPSLHLDARGLGWAGNYFNGEYPWLFERFREVHGDQPPYSTRYPRLQTLLQDSPPVPKGNVVTHNVSWGGRWLDVYDFWAYDFHGVTVMKDNWIADPDFIRRRAVAEKTWDPYYLNIDAAEGYRTWRSDEPETRREFAGNRIAAKPPGKFDPDTLAFTPSDPAALQAMGFEAIPVDKIGLQRNQWRKEVPPR